MKKDSMARELMMEVIVGGFMVLIFLGLVYFTIILSRERWFQTKYTVEVIFRDVMGLRVGDSVVVRGMPIGKVKHLDLRRDGVHVFGMLDQPVHLRQDYRIRVVSTSILGGRYLQIHEGSDSAPELPEDTVCRGEEAYDLMADAAEAVNALKKALTEKGGILDNFKDAMAKIQIVADRLESGKGTLGKLLSEDDTLYRDLSSTVSSLKNITGKIEKGEGTIGRLVQEDGIYNDVKATVKEVRGAVDDFRENTPVVTFTSILFGAL